MRYVIFSCLHASIQNNKKYKPDILTLGNSNGLKQIIQVIIAMEAKKIFFFHIISNEMITKNDQKHCSFCAGSGVTNFRAWLGNE